MGSDRLKHERPSGGTVEPDGSHASLGHRRLYAEIPDGRENLELGWGRRNGERGHGRRGGGSAIAVERGQGERGGAEQSDYDCNGEPPSPRLCPAPVRAKPRSVT